MTKSVSIFADSSCFSDTYLGNPGYFTTHSPKSHTSTSLVVNLFLAAWIGTK